MLFKLKKIAIAISILPFLSLESLAAISITNFSITENSVSFDISGTLPPVGDFIIYPTPVRNKIYFVNHDLYADPGLVIGNWAATNSAYTGAIPMLNGIAGDPSNRDHFYFVFDALDHDDDLSGTVTATWSSTVFDPSIFSRLDVLWGDYYGAINIDSPISPGGTILTSIVVPEPSSLLLLGLGAATLISHRHRT